MVGKPAPKHLQSARCRVGSPALSTATRTLITLSTGKAWTDDRAPYSASLCPEALAYQHLAEAFGFTLQGTGESGLLKEAQAHTYLNPHN